MLKKFGYDVDAVMIDLLMGDWSEKNLANVKNFCKERGVKLHIIKMREEFGCSICYIRSGIQSKVKLTNCLICGVVKRWLLNKKSRELGATKLVTGHNLDDEAENVLMNFFKGNMKISIGLGPKTGVISDKKFVQRIKPLYFCSNDEIRQYSKGMNFPVQYEPCPCAVGAFRRTVRKEIAKLEEQNPGIKRVLVNNFLTLLPLIIKKYKGKDKLQYCSSCGEPSRNLVCKRCELIKILKK
ncbi:TIGR00269 family protein [Candidatus Woesearchaeota archaeon]|nr:TIGR00269 family protein [Candidatus Woesearchaeota archaeon]